MYQSKAKKYFFNITNNIVTEVFSLFDIKIVCMPVRCRCKILRCR